MYEAKPRPVDKKEPSTETDEGLGSSSGRQCSSGSAGSMYLSDSQDWAVSPDQPPAQHLPPSMADDTFNYMTCLALEPSSYSYAGSQGLSKVLSSHHGDQTTKTCNDMEVVTHLLAERDRDLELAARIGQSLLQRNHLLQERTEALEEQLAQALDQALQLQHELSKKEELLRIVASVTEDTETDWAPTTPLKQPPALGGHCPSALSQLEVLQGKLQDLEEENLLLRSEACQLKSDTITYEEKEQQLVIDCVKELREANGQMGCLSEELSQKNEELLRHQEEMAQLLSQLVELQQRVRQLALEKEELRIHLQASKDSQRQLTAELDELADRNAECVEMLHESQQEIRELRNKNTPSGGLRRHLSYGLYPMDSLAAEIEGTMRRELSVEEEATCEDQRVSQKRVFQTVRSVNTSASRALLASAPIPGSGQSSLVMTAQPFQSNQGEEVRLGQPGSPGGNDLNKALHRLSLRRQNFLCERQFFQAEREKKLQALAGAEGEAEGSGCSTPMGSSMSSYSNLSELSIGSYIFKTFLPEKLQIVKPMEGSLTLHHWQQLAKPHLGTILDPHPGVVTKGFCHLAQDAVYRLSDMEEDEQGEEEGRGAVLEKGAAERGKAEEDEEEGEGGITFNVRCSSTPEDRKHAVPPGPSSPLVPSVLCLSPAPLSNTAHITAPTPPLPGACTVVVHSSTATSSSSVQHPGKCQSSTFSTYTFTTCRILHPSDSTQVTPSCQSSLLANTPSSMRTGPNTPVTPCRLSLGACFPPRRPPVAPGSLAKLVLERGISAQVSSTDTPPASPKPATAPCKPLFCLLPSTPPNSPSHSPPPSPLPANQLTRQQNSTDTFLASRPAELFLQDVYGLNLGRAPHPDLPSPSQGQQPAPVPPTKPGRPRSDPVNVGLVERLRRLGFNKVLHGPESEALVPRQDSATFVSAGGGSLLDGLRRNQSLPAMIGARALKSNLNPTPPPQPPTSLDIPPPPWGNLKDRRQRLGSLSHAPSSSSRR